MKDKTDEPKPPVRIVLVKPKAIYTRYDQIVRLCEINPNIIYLIQKLNCEVPL